MKSFGAAASAVGEKSVAAAAVPVYVLQTIAGDEALIYTLNLNPMSCIAVSQIPHKAEIDYRPAPLPR